MFSKVLIANRGEIACRIIRTLRLMGITSVAVYSEADAHARHVLDADEAYLLGSAPPAESYLNGKKLIEIAQKAGAEAIHPGYGFLSENQVFCKLCEKNGIVFIGPDPLHMEEFGLKHRARELAEQYQVPLLPGSSLLKSLDEALLEANKIGYPVMLKSSAGGGGIGMEICRSDENVTAVYDRLLRLSENNFSDNRLFLEKYIENARHIEVQVFGDGQGKALILGDRDCSVQRRNQKIIEETPAPGLSDSLRGALHQAARQLVEGVQYKSAGTVEFVYDSDEQQFYFLEVNTRLQVEHCVTEEIYSIDLVEWMVRLASGKSGDLFTYALEPAGASIEVRVYAEDPGKNFQPSAGVLTEVVFPDDIRVESWVVNGTEVSAYYDPLLAKLIVHAPTRSEAVRLLQQTLNNSRLSGFETNLNFLRQASQLQGFTSGDYSTRLLDDFVYSAQTIAVDAGGMQTTIQDFPGRTGYWAVGVPPSGPMDSLNHRLANRIAGNSPEAAALEITVKGPVLTFNTDCIIALSGADLGATIDGAAIDHYKPIQVQAGSTLKTDITKNGQRAYLAVRGGFEVPLYMGSRSTFTLGQFGGHGGRSLCAGDVLRIGSASEHEPAALPASHQPEFPEVWEIGVLYGPHGAPDFFTDKDIETFFNTTWEIHYNSSRTGVRLIGPSPEWAREDGGEAGLHPSNIHDNAYAIGAIDYTGDMPVILGPDGPSLGGFVCPATIVQAELWKVGQLRPGDTVRFKQVTLEQAEILTQIQEQYITSLCHPGQASLTAPEPTPASHPPILKTLQKKENDLEIVFRIAGDTSLLIEYGELKLDLSLRFRVHATMLKLEEFDIPGIIDVTPGIRSLQVHFDNRIISVEGLIRHVERAEEAVAGAQNRRVPARIVHLPLSWDDPSTHKAIDKYMHSVRPDAPWCPSNIEFIRRINGLESVAQVKQTVFDASYLVMGLGDVYLGAPVATPLDPRHRLVTTKYNPARTWTPENAVGIGGAYLCVYGMEGPGGYQFVGRTVQMWNRYNTTKEFGPGTPWLLRFFDQIRFYPVSHEELTRMRRDFPHGLAGLKIEETSFDLDEYERFLDENRTSIDSFKQRQQTAFEAERQEWIKNGQLNYHAEETGGMETTDEVVLLPGCDPICSEVTGSLWKLNVVEKQRVSKGETLAILECMKMEISLASPSDGVVKQLLCTEGEMVTPGQQLFSILPS